MLLLARQSSRVLAEREAAVCTYSAALRRSQQVRDPAAERHVASASLSAEVDAVDAALMQGTPEPADAEAEWPQRLRNSHGPPEPSPF